MFTAVKKKISLADSILIINEKFPTRIEFRRKFSEKLDGPSLFVSCDTCIKLLDISGRCALKERGKLKASARLDEVHCIQIRQMYKWGGCEAENRYTFIYQPLLIVSVNLMFMAANSEAGYLKT